jgi:DNA polymerase
VTGARDLLQRYLEQRREAGEEDLVLEQPPGSATGPPAGPPSTSRETLQSGQRQANGAAGRRQRSGSPPDRRSTANLAAEGGQAGTVAERQPPPPIQPPARKSARRKSGVVQKDWREGAPPIPPAGIVVAPPASDLFTGDELAQCDLEEVAERVGSCNKCRLCDNRTNAVPGDGPADARLVVVGEGPGAKEDDTGLPFVGRAGELLTDVLQAIDLVRERVFICNIVKCRPPANRKPLQDEIDACVAYLYRQIEVIQPKVILAMGGTAAETLLNTKRSLASLRNRVHSFRGIQLLATYHPAALLRNPNWKKPTWDDVRIARQLLDR